MFDEENSWQDIIYIVALSSALVAISFWLQGDIGLNLADEGYLWYGALRTLEGDVPIRDFRSYDPGRYYWVAGGSFLFGKGILGVRESVAIFQFIGLFFGLLATTRIVKSRIILILVGVLLVIWMFPRFKLFETSITMIGVYVACQLIEHPSKKRLLIAGIFCGLAAFLGRNHGLYNFLAFTSLLLFSVFTKSSSSTISTISFI